jgi:putative hydrolase of the HAD superfamily
MRDTPPSRSHSSGRQSGGSQSGGSQSGGSQSGGSQSGGVQSSVVQSPVAVSDFARIETWVFDLDNTLYPSGLKLFRQIDQRMGEFIQRLLGVSYEQAQHLRKTYYRQFGTTLSGLMRVHRIEPEPFLDYVHDIDLTTVGPDLALRAAIERLEGRRLIFTNGSRRHGERIAEKVGILDLFEDICGIEHCQYVPKPDAAAFDRFLARHAVDARVAAMFEDMPQNLEVPHLLGMRTVLVESDDTEHPRLIELRRLPALPPHIHFTTGDLTGFLTSIPQR